MQDRNREAERLEFLARLRILDTEAEPPFDRFVELARKVFEVPIAAVSFVDSRRQWFKARCGLPFGETSREAAFCDRTICSDDVYVIEDAQRDAGFAKSLLVSGPPFARFYAGAPLNIAPGIRVGALCVMDDRPRRFSSREADILRLLAEAVCEHLRLHDQAACQDSEVNQGRQWTRLLLGERDQLSRDSKVLRQVSRLAKIGGWTLDFDAGAVTWSDEIYSMLEVETGLPIDLDSGLSMIFEKDRQLFADLLKTAVETGQGFEAEIAMLTRSGSVRWLRVLGEREPHGNARRLFGTVQDVTARHATEAELLRLGTTDPLTGLPNRYALTKTINATLAGDAPPGAAALLLLDLDDFKDVNDMLGHDAGDHLLSVLGRRLSNCLHQGDAIGRLGGDEFGVFLRSPKSLGDIPGIAQMMLEAAGAPITHLGHSMRVGASIGVAIFPRHGADAESLLKRADIALYSAKHVSGDCYLYYDDGLGEAVARRASLLQEARRGLDLGLFTVAYQPVVNLRDDTILGMEALIRWNHPERGLLPAGAFLEALEEPNLGRLLSYEAMRIAIAQYGAWRRDGFRVGRLGLNLTAGQLRDFDFIERLSEHLSSAGLEPTLVTAEITESVLLGRGTESILQRILALHEMGVRLALDDFGTGYASLTHLRQLPIDVLKIDASFVSSLPSGGANTTIVKTVIDMAHALGLATVAEGVEGPEIHSMLKLMGCDRGQGYYYGRPMLAERVPDCVAAFASAAPHRLARAG